MLWRHAGRGAFRVPVVCCTFIGPSYNRGVGGGIHHTQPNLCEPISDPASMNKGGPVHSVVSGRTNR